jgi:hypothetical protein
MPGAEENILSFANIQSLIDSVQCNNDSMQITFNDANSFATANGYWNWVNQAVNHTFVLVVPGNVCDFSATRFPFLVTNLESDITTLTTHLSGAASLWGDIAHSYELTLGAIENEFKVRKRFGEIDYSKNITVDFNHQIPNPGINLTDTDIEASMSCPDCGTTGSFNLSFTLKTKFFIPTDASVTLQANKVAASLNPSVGVSASLSSAKTLEYPFPDINIASIQIPGVLTIGPVIETALGLIAGPLQGSANIEASASMSLPDTASVTIDLEKRSFTHTDWTPVYQASLEVDAGISGNLTAYAKASVAIKAQALSMYKRK